MLQLGMLRLGLVLPLILMSIGAHASSSDDDGQAGIYGAHYGYISDVIEEKNKRDIEMVMLDKPKEDSKPFREVIFNDKLSREFQQQYEYRFGQTTAQQVINSPGRSDEYTYYTGQNVGIVEYTKYQRQFAEYMGRRLTEYHVDNYVKSDPALRPVYQLKDKMSNLNMEVKKGYKVKWKYNFAGPSMDVTVDNPYEVQTNVHMDMSGILSAPVEVIYTLGYQLNARVRATAVYKQIDGIYQLVLSRQMTRRISTSITGSVDNRAAGPNVQQNLVLLGFSWSE